MISYNCKLSSRAGVRSEQILDSYTGQIQMVFRYSSLAEHWSLCDEVIPSEARSLQTIHWKKGHGSKLFCSFVWLFLV